MTRRSPIYYSDTQKTLMWERWKAGETLHQIAHLFDRSHSSVNRILGETGGIRPPVRRRSRLALTLAEREDISRCLVAGLSIRSIASQIGRAPSTVSREINRNGGQASYRAAQADMEAWRRAHRPSPASSWRAPVWRGSLRPSCRCSGHQSRSPAEAGRSLMEIVSMILPWLPQELYKSLTWDRGKEMAAHKRFTLATNIKVFFCDPQNPWQRGTNENTNGLLRQYFPKGVDISGYSQARLNAVARKLNERPRKTLDFRTPAEMYNEVVASTGGIRSRKQPNRVNAPPLLRRCETACGRARSR